MRMGIFVMLFPFLVACTSVQEVQEKEYKLLSRAVSQVIDSNIKALSELDSIRYRKAQFKNPFLISLITIVPRVNIRKIPSVHQSIERRQVDKNTLLFAIEKRGDWWLLQSNEYVHQSVVKVIKRDA